MIKRRYIILAFASLVLIGGICAILWEGAVKTGSPELGIDPAQNAAYASYEYGEPNTIYVRTQPLLSPTGLITEVMWHDRILEAGILEIGFTIKFYPYFKGYDVNHFLSNGDLQGGIGGDMPTLTVAATSEVVIAVKVQNSLTWLVGRRPFLLKELKGERIGYAYGSNTHFMLLSLLSSGGLSDGDVHLIPIPVRDMPDAMERMAIYFFAAGEPIPSIAELKYGFTRCFGIPVFPEISRGEAPRGRA